MDMKEECIWKGNWQLPELEFCQAIYIYLRISKQTRFGYNTQEATFLT